MNMSETKIVDARAFTRDFFDLANREPPPDGEARLATAWFELRMLALAEKHGLYCQNKRNHSEWMNIDHVFVPKTVAGQANPRESGR